jgi:hypothetical protein
MATGIKDFSIMKNISVDEGHRESPARCVDHAVDLVCQHHQVGGSSIHSDVAGGVCVSPVTTVSTGAGLHQVGAAAVGASDGGRRIHSGAGVLSVAAASDETGPGCIANAAGASRSPIWRTGVHEASHICAARFQNLDVAGSTLIEGPGYSGLAWSSGSKRALRGNAEYDDAGNDAHDAVAVRVADSISQFMTGAGEIAVADIFSGVQAQVIDLMAGGAGEMIFLGDAPPQFMVSDVISANALAGIICRSPASRASFIEFCYQEALEIIEANKPVVLALASALIDHPQRTLDATEIDQCIADTLDREARKAEVERRTEWRNVLINAAEFSAREISLQHAT